MYEVLITEIFNVEVDFKRPIDRRFRHAVTGDPLLKDRHPMGAYLFVGWKGGLMRDMVSYW